MSTGTASSHHDTIRIEEYTGILQQKLVTVWQTPDAITPWLPTEFLLSQYITRILITGRTSSLSTALIADPSWTQVWRSPGNKEWSCLMSTIQYMPGPVLVVIGPDMGLTPKLVTSLKGVCTAGPTTILVMRQPGLAPWSGEPAEHVFFPIVEGAGAKVTPLMTAINEWVPRAAPRSLDIKTLLPQLAAQGYALTVADGVWHWYKPADSTGLATLTVPQIARQLQILGAVLSTITV
jgi:hypothetical protein